VSPPKIPTPPRIPTASSSDNHSDSDSDGIKKDRVNLDEPLARRNIEILKRKFSFLVHRKSIKQRATKTRVTPCENCTFSRVVKVARVKVVKEKVVLKAKDKL
jgi:hypothetical protein